MPTWDRQNVRRRLRVDVAKDDYLLVLEYAIRRDLLGNDPAEKAIGLVGEVAIGHARSLGEIAGPGQDDGARSNRHRF